MSQELHLSPELLLERRRRLRWWWSAGVCLLLAWPATIGLRQLYGLGKGWRARQLSSQAEDLLRQEKFDEAAARARSAYQLKIDEPAAIRAVAHLQSAAGRPADALPFWRQLEELKSMTTADRLLRAEDLYRLGAVGDAERENAQIMSVEPDQPACLRLAARLALSRGNRELAIENARHARMVDPDNSDGKLLLAMLQCDAPDGVVRSSALQELLELGHDHTRNGLAALLALAARRDLPPEYVETVASLLREHPLATDGQRFQGLDLQIRTRPADRGAILDAAAEELRKADPAKRRAFGVWLNTHNEWERTLILVPLEEASQRQDLLLVHLDALAALRRWAEIQKILEARNVPLDPVHTELFLARSAMELGQNAAASLHWTQAHTAAASSLEQMWSVGKYAEMVGRTDEAERAYESLKSNASIARLAYEALLHLAQKQGKTVEQRTLLGEMRARWPKDAAVSNDYVYLSLLVSDDLAEGLRIARQLVKDSPTSLPHRTTLALALLQHNDPRAALEVYSGLQVDWEHAPSSARAVHAAVLGRNGLEAEARRVVASLRPEELRAEERDLVKPWT